MIVMDRSMRAIPTLHHVATKRTNVKVVQHPSANVSMDAGDNVMSKITNHITAITIAQRPVTKKTTTVTVKSMMA
tara:strand:- start:378 stop:602 length:225 start_codon:yes stop_codon:yes gene_type:complete